jgi:hypothetical protein
MAWCALALIVVTVVHLPLQRLPRLSDDSFQYLSAAHQLRSTHRVATSLVHFDTERSHGTIPAPLTWFPPGYPFAIAVVSSIGFSYETAALLISIASFVLVTGGLWCLMRKLDTSRWAARAAVLCWLTNSYALEYSVSALSEPMFTVFGLASLLFLVHTDETGASTHNGLCWIGSAAMAGASYWVRYAGFLWALTCLTLLLVQIIARGSTRKPSRLSAIVAGASLLLFLMPLMVRNVTLVGDWRGGNNTAAAMSISRFVTDTPRILPHLIFGNASVSQLWFPMVLMSIGLIGLCVTWRRAKVARHRTSIREVMSVLPLVTNGRIVLAAFLIYSAGIAAIAVRSVISYSPRMYVPVLPHLIALLACGIAFFIRRLRVGTYSRLVPAMVLCLLLGYVIGNSISRISLGPDQYERTEEAMLRPDEAGSSIKQLLDLELKAGEVIAATNGQAAGYVLNHATLSLVGRPYSLVTWNAPKLRMELARFAVTHLLVFRDIALDPVIGQSPFLAGLAAGQSPPWLRLAGFNRDIYVYRVQMSTPDTTHAPPSQIAPSKPLTICSSRTISRGKASFQAPAGSPTPTAHEHPGEEFHQRLLFQLPPDYVRQGLWRHLRRQAGGERLCGLRQRWLTSDCATA